MPQMQHLVEGFDFTSVSCITPSELTQAIRNAKPVDPQGWIIWSNTAPDAVTYPELANFLWGKLNSPTDADLYFYNGSSWELFPVKIVDGSITLNKISLAGTTPYYIIQVNGAGTALQWVSIPTAIQDNTIPPAKLVTPNNTDKFVLISFTGTKQFITIAAFFTGIDDNIIPVTKLIKGSADPLRQFLSTKVDGSAIEWYTLDLANIGAAGFTALQAARRNSGNTAWEPFTPVNPMNESVLYALPSSGGVQLIPHGLSTIPRLVDVRLRCVSAVDGYSVGDQINIAMPIGVYSSLETTPFFTYAVDGTNILVLAGQYGGSLSGVFYQPKGGGAAVTFDSSKWNIKANFIQ